jgi:polyisoprenoid-binding protein YceI
MTANTRVSASFSAACLLAATVLVHTVYADEVGSFNVQGGKVKFDAATNFSAVSVHGESSQMSAQLKVRNSGDHLEVTGLQAKLDPKTFSTGMALRDEHMNNKIFAAGDGAAPELEFVAEKVTCPVLAKGQETTCPIAGELSMRGVKKPFVMNLKIRNDGKAYRASGGGNVKLSAFGVEPPCQLGVCVKDDVKLQVEFQAKESNALRSSSGGRQ